MEKTIKKLEPLFAGKGMMRDFKFKQIHSNRRAYMYELTTSGGYMSFEVFERKNVPICLNYENHEYSETEFKEVYPKAKDFGTWAFTFKTKLKAIQKLNTYTDDEK